MSVPMKASAVLAASLVLGACAPDPQNVEPNYVGGGRYHNHSCAEIGHQLSRVSWRVKHETAELQETHNEDTLITAGGMIWKPALFWLTRGDESADLGRYKGELNALNEAAQHKDCKVASEIDQALKDAATDRADPFDPGNDRPKASSRGEAVSFGAEEKESLAEKYQARDK